MNVGLVHAQQRHAVRWERNRHRSYPFLTKGVESISGTTQMPWAVCKDRESARAGVKVRVLRALKVHQVDAGRIGVICANRRPHRFAAELRAVLAGIDGRL